MWNLCMLKGHQIAARGHSAYFTDPLQTSGDVTVSFRALSSKNVL